MDAPQGRPAIAATARSVGRATTRASPASPGCSPPPAATARRSAPQWPIRPRHRAPDRRGRSPSTPPAPSSGRRAADRTRASAGPPGSGKCRREKSQPHPSVATHSGRGILARLHSAGLGWVTPACALDAVVSPTPTRRPLRTISACTAAPRQDGRFRPGNAGVCGRCDRAPGPQSRAGSRRCRRGPSLCRFGWPGGCSVRR
jgi:hypothetical protein